MVVKKAVWTKIDLAACSDLHSVSNAGGQSRVATDAGERDQHRSASKPHDLANAGSLFPKRARPAAKIARLQGLAVGGCTWTGTVARDRLGRHTATWLLSARSERWEQGVQDGRAGLRCSVAASIAKSRTGMQRCTGPALCTTAHQYLLLKLMILLFMRNVGDMSDTALARLAAAGARPPSLRRLQEDSKGAPA
jgi:hypothetical protein